MQQLKQIIVVRCVHFPILFFFRTQLKDETAKLLELKNKIDNDQGSQKFVLKTPKVWSFK